MTAIQKFEVHNFSKINLLRNGTIQFLNFNENIISFNCPTITDMYDELDFNIFIHLLELTPNEIRKYKLPFIAKEKANIIKGLISHTEYSKYLIKYFTKYINNFDYKNKELYINNNLLTNDELEFIIEAILIACGRKEYFIQKENTIEASEEEDNSMVRELMEQAKKAEEKVQKANKYKQQNSQDGLSTDDVMMAILYEFPSLQINDIFAMNYFTMSWYFSYIGKIDQHRINTMAYANGAMKKNYKHKHMIMLK